MGREWQNINSNTCNANIMIYNIIMNNDIVFFAGNDQQTKSQ